MKICVLFFALLIIATSYGDDDLQNSESDLLTGSWPFVREEGFDVDYSFFITFQTGGESREFFEDESSTETNAGTWSRINDDRVCLTHGPGDINDFVMVSLTSSRFVVTDEDEDKFELEKI
ncbi:MAG: hypothetical protein AAF519_04110 [Bacteroidota bacterium]